MLINAGASLSVDLLRYRLRAKRNGQSRTEAGQCKFIIASGAGTIVSTAANIRGFVVMFAVNTRNGGTPDHARQQAADRSALRNA
jgi:hypothetical protein